MKIIATRMPQIKYDCDRKAENSSSVMIRGEFFGVSGGKIYALNRCVLVSLIIQEGAGLCAKRLVKPLAPLQKNS
ncbi:MAG: hypothetical protein D3920_14795 [Candidatus Electrothrix sp. AW2]|nr:hypothetical protein [Candidatus Electrothrix gigas]